MLFITSVSVTAQGSKDVSRATGMSHMTALVGSEPGSKELLLPSPPLPLPPAVQSSIPMTSAQLGSVSSSSGTSQPARTQLPLDFRNLRMDNPPHTSAHTIAAA